MLFLHLNKNKHEFDINKRFNHRKFHFISANAKEIVNFFAIFFFAKIPGIRCIDDLCIIHNICLIFTKEKNIITTAFSDMQRLRTNKKKF